MKKILFVVGSFRKNSFNLRLAREAEKVLAGKAEVRYLDYAGVPPMNQDIEYPAPEAVAQVRREVMEADALWIFTPEYNYSYPGHLKNMLDWLSRPLVEGEFGGATAIAGRRVCLSGAGGKGAVAQCLQKLTDLLSFIRADVVREPQLGVPLDMQAFFTDRYELTAEQQEVLKREAEELLLKEL